MIYFEAQAASERL